MNIYIFNINKIMKLMISKNKQKNDKNFDKLV